MAFGGAASNSSDAALHRQADNGNLYTMEEFQQYYQQPLGTFGAWRQYWDRAGLASTHGASQPVTPQQDEADVADAADAAPAAPARQYDADAHAAEPAAALAAPAAEPVAAPAAPGDLQPGPLSLGDIQLALLPTTWQDQPGADRKSVV